MPGDQTNDLFAGRFFRDGKLFAERLFPAQDFKRLESGFREQAADDRRRQRLCKIIDRLEFDAVLTEQQRQIAARRSRRLLIDRNFFRHKSSPNLRPFFYKRLLKSSAPYDGLFSPPFLKYSLDVCRQILSPVFETVSKIRPPHQPVRF